MLRIARYVAIGDSSTEGLVDPDGRGGYIGWSRRLAQRIAAAQGAMEYANLAQKGLTTREIRDRQFGRALALQPDLVSLFSGTNDVLARDFDVRAFATDTRLMQGAFRERGATVITFTLPDLTPLLPMARRIAPRILDMNAALREVCAETGALYVDFAQYPVTTDARLWNPDRIHANAAGHARIAEALAEALEVAGASHVWSEPLPVQPPPSTLRRALTETAWTLRYLVPFALGNALLAGRRPAFKPGPVPHYTRIA
ncbi:MAG: SGNH/GDSL hydrolase family protein [Candidatus Eisenbacteria bacterium]|nr:SGNH/GDSL hydrolase family protein [Candidatus Eisenbacteria bacterium]